MFNLHLLYALGNTYPVSSTIYEWIGTIRIEWVLQFIFNLVILTLLLLLFWDGKFFKRLNYFTYGLFKFVLPLRWSILLGKKSALLSHGTRLDHLDEFLATSKIYCLILKPSFVDMRIVYWEAREAGRDNQARWLLISFWCFGIWETLLVAL